MATPNARSRGRRGRFRRGISGLPPLFPACRVIAYEYEGYGKLARGHPSRRPPAAGPQEEVSFGGQILDPHGEEPAKAGVSNHAGRARSATSQLSHAIALRRPPVLTRVRY